jgi:hypothetical protein
VSRSSHRDIEAGIPNKAVHPLNGDFRRPARRDRQTPPDCRPPKSGFGNQDHATAANVVSWDFHKWPC